MTYKTGHDTLDAALAHVLDSANGHNTISHGDELDGAPFITWSAASIGEDVLMVDDNGDLEDVPEGWTDRSWILHPSEFFEPYHLRYHFDEVGAFERGERSELVIDWVMVDRYPDEEDGETWEDDRAVGHVYGITVYN